MIAYRIRLGTHRSSRSPDLIHSLAVRQRLPHVRRLHVMHAGCNTASEVSFALDTLEHQGQPDVVRVVMLAKGTRILHIYHLTNGGNLFHHSGDEGGRLETDQRVEHRIIALGWVSLHAQHHHRITLAGVSQWGARRTSLL
jgi:hypothetical protein